MGVSEGDVLRSQKLQDALGVAVNQSQVRLPLLSPQTAIVDEVNVSIEKKMCGEVNCFLQNASCDSVKAGNDDALESDKRASQVLTSLLKSLGEIRCDLRHGDCFLRFFLHPCIESAHTPRRPPPGVICNGSTANLFPATRPSIAQSILSVFFFFSSSSF